MSDDVRIAFVCGQNAEAAEPLRTPARFARGDAGRSQMATPFAEREARERGWSDSPSSPADLDAVRAIRDEIEERVAALFDDLDAER